MYVNQLDSTGWVTDISSLGVATEDFVIRCNGRRHSFDDVNWNRDIWFIFTVVIA